MAVAAYGDCDYLKKQRKSYYDFPDAESRENNI